MTDGATIRASIRRALGAGERDAERHARVAARLSDTPRGVVPQRGQLPEDERVALFRQMAEATAATMASAGGIDDVPAAVADYLRQQNLPAAVRTGADPALGALAWDATSVAVERGAARDGDTAAVSRATAGIAEIGAVVLISGADNPTTLNFLPEAHIVVVERDAIVGDYETAWDMVRARFGRGAMPRAVNIVAGPSRSGDIQQTMLFGAHGPRRLHLIVVG